MTEPEIKLPATESSVRRLDVGDIVRVTGLVHTMRDMGYRRMVETIQRGEPPSFDLTEGAIWHCGPIARNVDGRWQIVAAGPTSSSRFTELGARLVEMCKVRFTIGKGTMGPPMVSALSKVGGVYLVSTGGCAVLYAQQITNVENVHWLELGMPEATWVLKVEKLGPLVVGIDSKGNTLTSSVLKEAKTRIEQICRDEKIDPARNYVWWPKKVAGSERLMESLKTS